MSLKTSTNKDGNISFTVDNIDNPLNTKLPCIHYIDESPPRATASSKSKSQNSNSGDDLCFIMFHGNPTWSYLYRKMIPDISKHYRCIAIDCPGFGLSCAPGDFSFKTEDHIKVLFAVINKINETRAIKNIITVHQDWGGPCGFGVACKLHEMGMENTKNDSKNSVNNKNISNYPKQVGFVIGNTWCWIINRLERWDVYAFSCVFGGFIGKAAGYGYNFVIRNFWRKGFYIKQNKDIRYWYDAPFQKNTILNTGENNCTNYKNSRKGTYIWPAQLWDAQKVLKEIEYKIPLYFGDLPCLLCWGIQDLAFLKNYELKRFANKVFVKNHKIVELKNGSHFWQEDDGKEAAKHVLQWVNEQKLY